MQSRIAPMMKALMALEMAHDEVCKIGDCVDKWQTIAAIEKAHGILLVKHKTKIKSMNGNIVND